MERGVRERDMGGGGGEEERERAAKEGLSISK